VAGIGASQSCAFRYNTLIRFHGIAGRDGLFSSTAWPFWVIADRGMLVAAARKMRHLAAGSSNPIKAFCSSVCFFFDVRIYSVTAVSRCRQKKNYWCIFVILI
jgi:hypothetical protein